MSDLDHLIETIANQTSAITIQTAAITALVESNQRLMMILTEGMVDEEADDSLTYLDGSAK